MKTQKQLLTEHRILLDKKFKEKYPDGQFVLQFNRYIGIYNNPRRRTASTTYRCIGVAMSPLGNPRETFDNIEKHIYNVEYQNSSFGKIYYYKTLDALIASAKKKGVPAQLIQAFIQKYNSR